MGVDAVRRRKRKCALVKRLFDVVGAIQDPFVSGTSLIPNFVDLIGKRITFYWENLRNLAERERYHKAPQILSLANYHTTIFSEYATCVNSHYQTTHIQPA